MESPLGKGHPTRRARLQPLQMASQVFRSFDSLDSTGMDGMTGQDDMVCVVLYGMVLLMANFRASFEARPFSRQCGPGRAK